MNSRYVTLATLELHHPYFADGLLRDAQFVLASEGPALLRAGHLLVRQQAGMWQLVVEHQAGQPRVALADGRTLWLGIHPNSANWGHVTQPLLPPRQGGAVALLSNASRFDALDTPRPVQLASGIHRLVLLSAARPVNVTLRRGAAPVPGEVLQQLVVRGANDTAALDLRALPTGLYQVEENDGLQPATTHTLLVDTALQAARVPVVVALQLSAALYGAVQPPVWRVNFAAAAQALEYYVVARNFAALEFSQLQVQDESFNDEGRPPIVFDRIEQAALDPVAELSPLLMGADAAARIVLFRSRSPVARRQHARRRLELTRNGDVLIDHLPQPDANRATSQFVIHLSKP